MTASQSSSERATDAIFNADLFDRRCAELGAATTEQKAALVGVDWTTIHRFRKGATPRLTLARQIAERLGVSIDELWQEVPS